VTAYDAAEPNQWDKFQDSGHSHWHNSLILGRWLENVSIVGAGLITGKALGRERGGGDKPSPSTVPQRDAARLSVLTGGHFGILVTGWINLTIDNLMIDTNRDGMDIDSCRNVEDLKHQRERTERRRHVLKGSHALALRAPREHDHHQCL